jgi:hypothetical protein
MSRGKLIAIGILSVVLLAVIVVQFGGDKRRVVSKSSPRFNAGRRKSSAEQTAAPVASPARSAIEWPALSIAQVISHNPFALPDTLRPEGGAWANGENSETTAIDMPPNILEMRRRRVELLASLRRQGVDMILMTPQGRVARVGDLSLRVGDVVEGLKVQQINSTGIVFVEEPGAEE